MAKRAKSGGRKRGTPNRATGAAREAIGRLVDGNAHKLQRWIDQIEKKNGAQAAFDCFVALLEFSIPKLARQELTGAGGQGITFKTTIDFGGS